MLCRRRFTLFVAAALTLAAAVSCAPEYRPWWLGGTPSKGGVFAGVSGAVFSEVLIDDSTFIDGRAVTTVTHVVDDMARRRVPIDFNGDGRVDPVAAYGPSFGVIQIVLSQGAAGSAEFLSLTLDGGDNPWAELLDVAVGDIDGDGRLDLVAATRDGVVYVHHPSSPFTTTDLREWGGESGDLELIEGTTDTLSGDEQLAIITQALGPTVNLDNYIITVEQGYTNVEIGDFDNDGHNDIVASRRLKMNLEPAPSATVEPIFIVAGSLQVLINPGRTPTGEGWVTAVISQHERHSAFDRDGARGVWAVDLDQDGDLDLVSVADDDINVQVAWFENPGGPGTFDPSGAWTQYRIGSLRGAQALDVADITGDGLVDVVATGPEQTQIKLFAQPATGPKHPYDWDTATIVTFENFQPLDIKALDVDLDGVLELVVGTNEGALRYFESPADVSDEWRGEIITTFDPAGHVSLLGYGDVDGDGDLDLVAAVDDPQNFTDRLVWVRNELYP